MRTLIFVLGIIYIFFFWKILRCYIFDIRSLTFSLSFQTLQAHSRSNFNPDCLFYFISLSLLILCLRKCSDTTFTLLPLCQVSLVPRFFHIIELMCRDIMSACISMHHVHAWGLQRPEHDVGFPETEVTDGCELQCRF